MSHLESSPFVTPSVDCFATMSLFSMRPRKPSYSRLAIVLYGTPSDRLARHL